MGFLIEAFRDAGKALLEIARNAVFGFLTIPFPSSRPLTLEDKLRIKMKGQHSIIRDQQGKLESVYTALRERGHRQRDLDQLLSTREKELIELKRQKRSLERQLDDARNRSMRRR
jgi:hypothetical protein